MGVAEIPKIRWYYWYMLFYNLRNMHLNTPKYLENAKASNIIAAFAPIEGMLNLKFFIKANIMLRHPFLLTFHSKILSIR